MLQRVLQSGFGFGACRTVDNIVFHISSFLENSRDRRMGYLRHHKLLSVVKTLLIGSSRP